MKPLAFAAAAAFAGTAVFAQSPAPAKGPVVGILHALHATTSVEATAAFYRDVFGFSGEPRPFPNPAVPLLTNSPGVSLRNLIYRMPFAGFNYELTEFGGVERHAAQAEITDPGAMRLILVVRDLNPVVAAVKGRGAPVLTRGGNPVTVGSGLLAHRVFVARDPDGFIVEVDEDREATAQNAALRMRGSA